MRNFGRSIRIKRLGTSINVILVSHLPCHNVHEGDTVGGKEKEKWGSYLSPSHIQILSELYATFSFVEKHICPVNLNMYFNYPFSVSSPTNSPTRFQFHPAPEHEDLVTTEAYTKKQTIPLRVLQQQASRESIFLGFPAPSANSYVQFRIKTCSFRFG